MAAAALGLSLAWGCAAAGPPASSKGAPEVAPPSSVVERQPPPPRKPATTFFPTGPGSEVYVSPAPRVDPQVLRGMDDYQKALFEVAAEAARGLKLPVPAPDPRLNALAEDIARLSRGDRYPPREVLHFLSAHQGVVEPDPVIYTLRGPEEARTSGGKGARSGRRVSPPGKGQQPDLREAALDHFREVLPAVLKHMPINRIGVGAHSAGGLRTTAMLFWDQRMQLDPFPRRLPSDGRAFLRGRFLGRSRNPQVVMTMPGGFVRRLPLTIRDGAFESEIRCAWGDGRYQVEMMASDDSGPGVLANFPVYCGLDPPVDIAAYEDDDPSEIDPALAEQEIFALINNERRTAGLSPLIWDDRLAAIARAHSRDMEANGFIAHVSPTTGDTESRVRRAGLRFDLILENVAREGGVRQAHQGFMNSPGHRANVLNGRISHVGVGVVVVSRRRGAPLVVTEMFAGQ